MSRKTKVKTETFMNLLKESNQTSISTVQAVRGKNTLEITSHKESNEISLILFRVLFFLNHNIIFPTVNNENKKTKEECLRSTSLNN
jgi:hypothetical protein